MLHNWKCPYAVKLAQYPFLMCQALMTGRREDYGRKEAALNAYCAHQRYCNCVDGIINSDGAKKCYQNQSAKKRG